MNYPKRVTIGDITVRDGFQHEEHFIPTEAKLWLSEELILAGFKHIEVSNFGNPKGMPQFKDADDLFKKIRNSKKLKGKLDDVMLTAITIRERAIQVSTIWGCPIEGPTEMSKAIEFTKRWFDIGASDVEHADHDGSASPDRVYKYFSMLLDSVDNPEKQIAHFHTTRGWGLANVLAALQAGMTNYESTMGGIGGQPANFVDGVPVPGTGEYYYKDPNIVGLVSTEDMVVMMDEMGIDTGLDVDRILEIGKMVERIVGRPLRSESIRSGRIPKHLKG